MTPRIVIANVNQFLLLLKKEPSLLTIGGLSVFRPYLTVTGAGCGKCNQTANTMNDLRPKFEASLSVLSPQEQQRIKALLNTESFCFYKREQNGQLSPVCF